jgi:hypothetical protein
MTSWPLFLSNTTLLHNIMLIFRKGDHYSAAQQATLQLDNKPVDAKQVEVLFDNGSWGYVRSNSQRILDRCHIYIYIYIDRMT